MEMFNFNDKVVIVTGGAQGIGKETAKQFLKAGAFVVVCDYNEIVGQSALQELQEINEDRIIFYKVDVSDSAQVTDMVQFVADKYGRIDVLINNAGVTADGFLVKMKDEDWDRVVSINLSGVFKCSRAVASIMLQQGSGVILNVTSVVGIYGNIGQTNYAATKAGIIGMTKSWAKEFGPKGIRVNAVAPGFIETPMTDAVPEKILNLMAEKTPLKKLGKPEDIAFAYMFLASDMANYINGEILSVDGGLVI